MIMHHRPFCISMAMLDGISAKAWGRMTWSTPAAGFPEGSYLVRIDAYRSSESLHYSQHMEKIYVNR